MRNRKTLRRFVLGDCAGVSAFDVVLFDGERSPDLLLIYGDRSQIGLVRLIVHGRIVSEGPIGAFTWLAHEAGLTVLGNVLPVQLPRDYEGRPVQQMRVEIERETAESVAYQHVGVVYA